MYGRENSEVVSATNAVSVTRKTLKGSMKNCSCAAVRLPTSITRAVSAQAARKVARLRTTFTSGAQRRAPTSARQAAPKRGIASSASSSISLVLAQ
jgi:hypothetical protein